ncbi:lipase family protein [Mycobacterium sp. D16R24]|uniref:lipase family protein n=1 Tax=Mycobacterium sp. D16R24 TaxID=1855656 RepID=UPI0025704FB3|nr:lipase family protein [Mycobacterium sp. D16R24]
MTSPAEDLPAHRVSTDRQERVSRPIPPADDPFCVPPDGFSRAAPGDILRSRAIDVAFLGRIPQRVTAYQLLYRTIDANANPQATVTTILLPAGSSETPRPIVSYQCAIDAITSKAFPSYTFQRRAQILGGATPFEYLLIAETLRRGWAVVVTDHEGSRGSWGAAREPGYCILDGLRAAVSFEQAGLSKSAPIALWGYSGGGLATGWAAELWHSYAPELNVVGAVLGSPVADLRAAFHRLNGSVFAGLAALVIAALRNSYPDFDAIVRQHVTAQGETLLSSLRQMSTLRAVTRFCFQKVDHYVDEPLEQILGLAPVEKMFEDTRLGQATPAMPLLVFQAIADPIIGVQNIDVLVRRYRDSGAHVTYLRDVLSEHLLLHPISTPVALAWISDRFHDRALQPSKTQRGALVLAPRTWIGLLRLGYSTLKVLTRQVF